MIRLITFAVAVVCIIQNHYRSIAIVVKRGIIYRYKVIQQGRPLSFFLNNEVIQNKIFRFLNT